MPSPSRGLAREPARGRTRVRTYSILALIALVLALGYPTPSLAFSTGGSGDAGDAPKPLLVDARCVAATGHTCVDTHWVEAGSTVRLTGRNLGIATSVVFYGRQGPSDDTRSPVTSHRRASITATVPQGARDGPLAVVTTTGARSRRWSGLVIDEPGSGTPVPRQTGTQPSLGTAVSAPRKVFYGGLRKPVFSFQIASTQPTDVTVRLIRLADHAVVRTWAQPQVAPGVSRRVVWDGTAGGKVQSEGYYSFQASTGTVSSARVTPAAGDKDSFAFYGNMFPIRGAHELNLGAGRFGAPRDGHTHQGQDISARCGTPLVAARAGKVAYDGYHSLAGYYVVISGDSAGQDYVYMHMRGPSLVKAGQRVYTGQPLGEVGQTGDAQGCHLHFELWSAPGWYKGGHPFDPLPELQRWDHVS